MGKLGIRTPEQSNSTRLNWQQLEEHFIISVTNFLGQSVATLTGSNDRVQLNIAGHGNYITDDPAALLQQELGWSLPFGVLNYWVKGIPAPDSQAVYQLNEQGLLASLTQAGWQVDFSRYTLLESHHLPGKIRLQQGDIILTLLIKNWSLNPAPLAAN
jgi:outer membrane lipoprotein LolB